MRTVLYRRHGNPADVLETVEVDDLPPPGDGEVLIRVLSRPVHYGDLLGIAGRYRAGGDLSVPAGGNRVGFEGFGLVEQGGPGVDLPPGTRVAFFPGRAAWSERAIVPVTYVTAVPDGISNDIAAQLHVNPLTALLLVRAAEAAGVIPGKDVVLLSAAGSAVARFALAVLGERGIDAIGIVRSQQGAAVLADGFPGVPAVATDSDGWREALFSAAAGRPIKAVLDAVGGPIASDLFAMLASGGALISYGDLSGEPISVPALSFSTRNLRISGVTVGSWAGLPETQRVEDLRTALRVAAARPELFPVAGHFDLAEAPAAASLVEKPGKTGVVLLTS